MIHKSAPCLEPRQTKHRRVIPKTDHTALSHQLGLKGYHEATQAMVHGPLKISSTTEKTAMMNEPLPVTSRLNAPPGAPRCRSAGMRWDAGLRRSRAAKAIGTSPWNSKEALSTMIFAPSLRKQSANPKSQCWCPTSTTARRTEMDARRHSTFAHKCESSS